MPKTTTKLLWWASLGCIWHFTPTNHSSFGSAWCSGVMSAETKTAPTPPKHKSYPTAKETQRNAISKEDHNYVAMRISLTLATPWPLSFYLIHLRRYVRPFVTKGLGWYTKASFFPRRRQVSKLPLVLVWLVTKLQLATEVIRPTNLHTCIFCSKILQF